MPAKPKPIDPYKYLEALAIDCLQCNDCLQTCEFLANLGLTPGEFFKQLISEEISSDIIDVVQRCDLCGRCSLDCPAEINLPGGMVAAREILLQSGMVSLDDFQIMMVDNYWHFFSLYMHSFGIDYQGLVETHFDTLFFPGCTLASYAPELTHQIHSWLQERTPALGFTEKCCGLPLSSLGLRDRGNRHVARIYHHLKSAGAHRLVTACPNCFYYLRDRLVGIEVISLYDLLVEAGVKLTGAATVSIHDSCPDRIEGKISQQVRRLLSGYPQAEMEHSGENTICCGSGGIVSMISPQLCKDRAQKRLDEFAATRAERLITACMACNHRFSRENSLANVIHCLELVFDTPIDYPQIQTNLSVMWEGEWGQNNLDLLSDNQLHSPEDDICNDSR